MDSKAQPPPIAIASGSLAHTADEEPWGFYDDRRPDGDIVWDEQLHAWLVLGYATVKRLALEYKDAWVKAIELGNDADVENKARSLGITGEDWLEASSFGSKRVIHSMSLEDHARSHRWWMRSFSGRTVEHLGDTLVRPITHAQLDRFARRGHAELYCELAERVAPRVIAAAMGLPWEDDEWLARMSKLLDRRLKIFALLVSDGGDSADPALIAEVKDACRELRSMVRPFAERRCAQPGQDVISMVWRDAPLLFGTDFEIDDVIATALIAFQGGSGTTRDMTANILYMYLTHAELQQELRDDPSARRNFIEEALRLYGALPLRSNYAKRDLKVGDVKIGKGDQVIMLRDAANRDPAYYTCPAGPNVHRKAPRDHLGFHVGPHACVGQGLARVQLSTIFSVVLERLQDLRQDPDAEQPHFGGHFIRGWRPLNILFTEETNLTTGQLR